MAGSEAQNKSRATINWQDNTGKVFFLIFVIIGALFTLWIEYASLDKRMSMGISILLMFIYAGCTYVIPQMKARADQIGDNVYYLGLLYTLISLAAAIYRLADQEGAVDSILRNFGIALVTTIVGIALRVIISQALEDPVEIERETRQTLLESTRQFRTELQQSANEFRQFTVALRQSVDETVAQNLKATKEAISAAQAHHAELSGAILAQYKADSEAFTRQSEALAEARSAFHDGLKDVTRQLRDLDISPDLFTAPIANAFSDLESAVTGYADVMETQRRRMEQALAGLDRLGEQAGAFDSAAQDLTDAARSMKQALADVSRLRGEIDTIVSGVSRFAGEADVASAKVEAFGSKVSGQLTDAFGQLQSDQARRLGELSDTLGKLNASSAQFDAFVSSFVQAGERFASRLEDSQETLARVREDMGNMADYIVRRLEKR